MALAVPDRLTWETLRDLLQSIEPAALLVEPRILRRVIRLDRRLAGLGLFVPHRKTYTIERDRLLAFVDWAELELPPGADLPRSVILIARVTNETLETVPAGQSILRCLRLLFHARVHLELARRLEGQPTRELARQRKQQLGEVEFAEIRSVLLKEELLFPEPSDLETYIEFAAVYLELRYFAEHNLKRYFPAIRDWAEVDRIISQDVYHSQMFDSMRQLSGAVGVGEPAEDLAEQPIEPSRMPVPTPWKSRQLETRARRSAALGNSVKAAIQLTRAAAYALPERTAECHAAADRELRLLTKRLQPVLQLSDREVDTWCAALRPLLAPASRGFWSLEARLLYDLQKVCVEQERGVFQLDLIEWIRTFGARPIRRPLPLLREVLITKHLRSADHRLATARLTPPHRRRLAGLLAAAVQRIEHHSRDRIGPLILAVLDEVGLVPQNLPERVARKKLVEELLDRIVEQGALNMGDLRNALAKNDLKLPDLSGVSELFGGDRLLRADRQLAGVLDGVYRPAAVYLRWPQRLSSVAFGTRVGRFITQYVVLPYGGAYLTLEGLRHLVSAVTGRSHELTDPLHAESSGAVGSPSHGPFLIALFLLGTWLAFLLHRPRFRVWCQKRLWEGWQLVRRLIVELPAQILHSPLVQRILQSSAYAAVRSYLLRPAIVTCLSFLCFRLVSWHWTANFSLDVFLVTALFLNSPVGRYADEWITDFVARAWHDLRIKVFAAAYHWVMDLFHRLMVLLERLVYTVDEWLHFRAGDNRQVEGVKLVAGTCWFFVSYFIVFVFTLLVEPQINPIKHFPVVTVAHKLILPTGPVLVERLQSHIGQAQAATLVWSTIWLIPGVCGFLVWELKGNWRLYAANRPRTLVPVAVGQHGETVVGLLRPGFHSGTLPKQFAGLRRATRKAQQSGDWKPVDRKRLALHRVQDAIRRFVQRDLLSLLTEAQYGRDLTLDGAKIRVATNRIDSEIVCRELPGQPVRITWEEDAGRLVGEVSRSGWLGQVPPDDRERFLQALTGLFTRAGVEETRGPVPVRLRPTMLWNRWLTIWSDRPQRCDHDPPAYLPE